jgi:hypothetical protein
VVFVGRVTAGPDPQELFDAHDDVAFELTVESVQKGDVQSRVEVLTPGGDGTCGITFRRARRYQVFADDSDGDLRAHLCGGTRVLGAQVPIVRGSLAETGTGAIPLLAFGAIGAVILGTGALIRFVAAP